MMDGQNEREEWRRIEGYLKINFSILGFPFLPPRELAKKRSQRYQQRMNRAYAQVVHPRTFTEGQLVLRMVEHVRRNLPGPSKFAPKWEGP